MVESGQTRMCIGCGRQIPVEYNVCPHCGRPQNVPQAPQQFAPQSSNLENDKIWGIIGTLLLLISPIISGWGIVIVIIGTVLLLISFNGLAKAYQDRSIFQNVLYGGVIFVVGLALAVAIIAIAAAGLISSLGGIVSPSNLQGLDLLPYLIAIVAALFIVLVCAVVGTVFIRKSLKIVAQRSGTTMFATAGTVLFVGSILTIIVIGFLIIWIAMLLLLVAFLELKTSRFTSGS
jgi:uncharacterized membrane protein